jgi:hypothetical protein
MPRRNTVLSNVVVAKLESVAFAKFLLWPVYESQTLKYIETYGVSPLLT